MGDSLNDTEGLPTDDKIKHGKHAKQDTVFQHTTSMCLTAIVNNGGFINDFRILLLRGGFD